MLSQVLLASALQMTQVFSGGLQINPLGTAHRYDISWRTPAGINVGLFDYFQVYSNEFGAQIGYATDPALLEAHIDVAFEPGFFVRSEDAVDTMDGLATAAPRTFGTRRIVRGQVNVNLQLDRIWLYSRSTVQFRSRDFEQFDEFQGIVVQHERWFEQALAVQARFAGVSPTRGLAEGLSSHWAYAEYTVGVLDGFGNRPNRVSVGVVSERWPWSSTTFNLDLYYSFAPEPIDGPGLLFAYWVEL